MTEEIHMDEFFFTYDSILKNWVERMKDIQN